MKEIKDPGYERFRKKKSPAFKKFRHWLEYWAAVLVVATARLFSVAANQRFGAWLAGKIAPFFKKDQGIADYQLSFCFPEKTPGERRRIIQDCFRNFGKSIMEVLVLDKIRAEKEKWISLENRETVFDAIGEGKGAIMLFGHFGNWELSVIVNEILNVQSVAIVASVDAKKLNELIQNNRKSSHADIVERGDPKSGRIILQCLKNNRLLWIGIDQDTKAQSVFVDFFGRPAKTPRVAANLAMKFSVPVISAFGFRMEDGRHRIAFERLSEGPYSEGEDETLRLTQFYSDAMERHIRQHPAQWAWFHRRWKNRPTDEAPTS